MEIFTAHAAAETRPAAFVGQWMIFRTVDSNSPDKSVPEQIDLFSIKWMDLFSRILSDMGQNFA